MNRKLALLGILVAGLMLVSPMASAQTTQYGSTSGDPRIEEDGKKCFEAVKDMEGTTCIVLYGHLFDLLNKVPINVQRPPDNAFDLKGGFSGTPGYEPVWNFNELRLDSSPGFVEYPESLDQDPRLHPERGLSSDIELASDVPITGYWYLSADYDEFSPAGIDKVPNSDDDPSYGVMPCLTVQMTLQTGRFVGQGDDLAQGRTTKTIVTGSALDGQGNPGVPAHPCADGNAEDSIVDIDDVIEFEVDLGTASGKIPQDKGFIVHVEWWTHSPGDPGRQEKVYQHQWNLRTGSDYLARVLLPIENPVRIETVRPQFFDGKVYVHGVLNSPLGSYDVDPGSIEISVFDESGKEVEVNNVAEPILRFSVDHDGHFKPVNATFPWDYTKDNLAPGTYTVKMTAKNWQWTAEAENSGTIVIAEDISKSRATDSEGNTLEGDPTKISDTEEGPGVTATTLLLVSLALIGAARLRRRS